MQREIEVLEKANIDQTHKIQDLTRANKLLENRSNSKESQVSEVLNKAMQFESKVGDMHTKIVKLTELKAMHERMVDEYRTMNKDLLNRLQKSNQPEYEKAMQDFKDMLDFAAEKLPEKTIVMQNQDEKPIREVAQPGQPLGKIR